MACRAAAPGAARHRAARLVQTAFRVHLANKTKRRLRGAAVRADYFQAAAMKPEPHSFGTAAPVSSL